MIFQKKNPDSTFATYLENVALHSSQDDVRNGEFVTLMTVHMAKGLEYEYIFLGWLDEEGIFPKSNPPGSEWKVAIKGRKKRTPAYVA